MLKFNKNRLLIYVTILVIVAYLFPVAASADNIPVLTRTAVFTVGSKAVEVDGQSYPMDVAPYIDSNGRVQVPVRYLANVLGLTPFWYPDTRKVVLQIGGDSYEALTIGSNHIVVVYPPAKPLFVTMDTAPAIIPPGRTMLPARWVVESLVGEGGPPYKVTWDGNRQTLTLTPSGG